MLIGIDASRANRKFKGGTEWYSYHLIRELVKLDAKNQYILYSDVPLEPGLSDLTGDGESAQPVKLTGRWQEVSSPHHNVRAKILNWPFNLLWTQLRLSYEMAFHRPDVLFIPAHTLPLIHPDKSVVTIHDIGFEREAGLYSAANIGPKAGAAAKILNFTARLITKGKSGSNIKDYHSWSARFALKKAKKIITISEFSKRELLEIYGAEPEKITVVHNGYNKNIYRPIYERNKTDEVLKKYDIISPYLFYVGRLEKKKNTDRLIEAYAIMRQTHHNLKHKLVLSGNYNLDFDEIKYVISEFNLTDDVIMTGWLPEADKPYLYAGADLFVFPSLYEGFGIPLLEAMASGTPIVCSNTASIPEVTRGAALLFNPLSRKDMAEKMAEVLLNPELAGNLKKKGFERVKNFSLTKSAEQTLKVITGW
ncbi:MAG: glycosyltransferase family 1 protein [bacterium]|nr:glycosyltransferase family 1 protein [bacterium]